MYMLFVECKEGGSIRMFGSPVIVRCDCKMDEERGERTSPETLPLGSFAGVWMGNVSHADANSERDMIGIRRDGRG